MPSEGAAYRQPDGGSAGTSPRKSRLPRTPSPSPYQPERRLPLSQYLRAKR
ncbi:unnamed protein product, partial [Nesidiocoris tenuis]